jgi:hypothetical protein
MPLSIVVQDDALPGKLLPRVLEGEGFGIIEDCGGVSGLERLAKAFQKKKGREYQELSEWLGIPGFSSSISPRPSRPSPWPASRDSPPAVLA